jgi:hypothetical protein
LAFAIEMHAKYPDEVGPPPDLRNLFATHRPIVAISDPQWDDDLSSMERIFVQMQGENWSGCPVTQPPAQALIKATPDVGHTSMSCGDIIVTEIGQVYMVAGCGFTYLGMLGSDELYTEEHTLEDAIASHRDAN